MNNAEPFDRNSRRLHRDRAAPHFSDYAFLRQHMIEELRIRLETVMRNFDSALDLGCADGQLTQGLNIAHVTYADAGFTFAKSNKGVQCDEDRLPFADASFDLVISAGSLHLVNDLPGALSLIRRSLKPDGLFLAAFIGGSSLQRMRASLLAGDIMATGGAAPRIAPMVDVRAAGDLLTRAGFTLPVVDSEILTIRYNDLFALVKDLRGAGETGVVSKKTPLSRTAFAAASVDFANHADADGRVSEQAEVLYLTAWSPAPDQPQPLRRGSGTTSLVDVLDKFRRKAGGA